MALNLPRSQLISTDLLHTAQSSFLLTVRILNNVLGFLPDSRTICRSIITTAFLKQLSGLALATCLRAPAQRLIASTCRCTIQANIVTKLLLLLFRKLLRCCLAQFLKIRIDSLIKVYHLLLFILRIFLDILLPTLFDCTIVTSLLSPLIIIFISR